MSEKINLNIRPKASIYALFTRFNYLEWFAIAEFVDNSTASFYAHEKELSKAHFDKLVVSINYDEMSDTITICDNAFGMELDDFKKAILLDSGRTYNSRNEYGYGLKSAATWFGKRWTVESTQLESTKIYKATIDVDELVSGEKNDTDIEISSGDFSDHYTKITITKLNRKLNTNEIKKRVINTLNDMYRRDFKTGKIDIIYNGVTLNFAEPEILHFRNQDWKKEINIDFDFEGRHYSADGFVGIMTPGGYEKSGFALFRHNRAICSHYKPSQIFGSQAQTQVSLKLFGELNMDSFDVNQPKDGFSWSAELESEFIKQLKSLIPEYIKVAAMSVKERKAEEESTKPENCETTKIKVENTDSSKTCNEIVANATNNAAQTKKGTEKSERVAEAHNLDGGTIFNYKDQSYSIVWSDELDGKFLYNFDKNTCQLKINKNNEYIKSIKDLSLASEISKIILAYVLAEDEAKSSINSNGYIPASVMHNQFDKILSNIR